MKSQKQISYFFAEFNNKKIKISYDFLKSCTAKELLIKLNSNGFSLGSGHEEISLTETSNSQFLFKALPYLGSPEQIIYLNLKND